MDEKREDSSMPTVKILFKKSGMTLHSLGIAMGYDEGKARQAAFQFMKSGDPRISMLRRFAKAMSVPLDELLVEKKIRSK